MTNTIEIRAIHNQAGLTIEARQNGGDWVTVQCARYKTRSANPSIMQYSTCIDPIRDEFEYFAQLDARGIQYTRVRS